MGSAFSLNTPKKALTQPTNTNKDVMSNLNNQLVIPAAVALTTLTNHPLIAAAKKADAGPPPDYIGKEMAAAFLPAIMTPLVGIIFPAFSMALFFIYIQQDDIAYFFVSSRWMFLYS